MSKVIRNIATQRPVWTSQPSTVVGVDAGLAPIVAFNVATMRDDYSGKLPSIPSLNGITPVVNRRGKALAMTGVGTGQILVPCKDTASFTAIFVGALSGNATGLHRPFSTYNDGRGHDVYYDGTVLYIQDYYSGGTGVWQFTYAYSPKVINLVISIEVGANLLKYPIVFIDGVKIVGTEVAPRIGTRLAGHSVLGIGCSPGTTGRQLQGQVNVMGWLPYAVSDSVARDLSRNPWQIFTPQSRQVPFDLVRGPAEPRQSYMMGTTAPEVSTAMPVITPKIFWKDQPQCLVGVDWSNPLTRGLIFAAIPTIPVNLADGVRLITSKRPSYNQFDVINKVYKNGIANHDGVMLYPAPVSAASPEAKFDINIVTAFTLAHQTAQQNGCLALSRGNGSSLPSWGIGLHSGSYNGIYAQMGTYTYQPTGGVFTTNAVAATVVGDGTTATVYSNGNFVASGAYSPATTQYAPSNMRQVFFGSTGPGFNVQNIHPYLGLVWNRALSAAEVKSISNNPYQVFTPINHNMWVAP